MSSTITTSIITGGTNSHATSAFEFNAFATDFVGQGVVGSIGNTLGASPSTGAFAVNAQGSPAMLVDLTAGSAWISATPTGQSAQALRAYMSANYTSYAISSNASGSTKYDWIYLKVDPSNANNPDVAADNVTSVYTSRSSSNTVDNNAPPTYGIVLAIITVANGASSITNANITDKRSQATPSAQVSTTGTGWSALASVPTSVSANGQRNYSVVTNSTDLTGSVSKGMRVRLTRTVAAPTQCTLLNGTSQWYNKTSPSGMTFTDDFVVSAWIKLTAYSASNQTIASRFNGTSGWYFILTPSGQVILQGFNASGSNFSLVESVQSVPLNKWIHLAAQLDMSAFTATSTTSYIMMDGINVPATVSRGGTNPTALIQAGNLEIGSQNAGTLWFGGQLAQVAIYSAKVTQANVLATISQTMTGSETSLISAYSFNNSITDLAATANNLTAQGSAVATTVDNPFTDDTVGLVTYGVIMSAVFSTNTTLVIQTPEGANLPTTGGVSAVAYSTAANPYGFPGQKDKWRIEVLYRTTITQSSPVTNTFYNPSTQITILPGNYIVGWEGVLEAGLGSAGTFSAKGTLSSVNNGESYSRLTGLAYSGSNATSSGQAAGANGHREMGLEITSQTNLFFNLWTTLGSSSLTFDGATGDAVLFANNAFI